MTKEQKEQLLRIYNSLCLIETKGDNTIIMGICLQNLKALYEELDIKE